MMHEDRKKMRADKATIACECLLHEKFACVSRSVVIYTIQNGPKGWFDTSNTREVAKRVVHTHLEEIYDLAWSPCNAYIMVCSIDHKSEIVKVNGETESIPLHKHDNYVQGVAFDPRGDFVCTNGLDRVCRVQALKWTKKKLKLDPRRTHVMKYHAEEPSASGVSAAASGAADDSEDVKDTEAAVAETSATAPQQQPPKHRDHLFLGTSVSAFFRRPCFTPDGEFLLVPAGLSVAQQGVEPELCTQMAHRSDFSKPYACIAGIDTPSLAIRACPSLFSMIDHKQADVQTLTEGRHRSIFAVLTTDTVYIHDTQHPNPLMKISNIHHANLNDCAWYDVCFFLVGCRNERNFAHAILPTADNSHACVVDRQGAGREHAFCLLVGRLCDHCEVQRRRLRGASA